MAHDYIPNPDADRERMALPLRDIIPTPHPAPDVKPEAVPSGKGRQHTKSGT